MYSWYRHLRYSTVSHKIMVYLIIVVHVTYPFDSKFIVQIFQHFMATCSEQGMNTVIIKQCLMNG